MTQVFIDLIGLTSTKICSIIQVVDRKIKMSKFVQLIVLIIMIALVVRIMVGMPQQVSTYHVTCWDRGETVIDEEVPYVRFPRDNYVLIIDYKGNKRHFYKVTCDIKETLTIR